MSGKCRPSLRKKTLGNVKLSNLSQTDKECIYAVFERFENMAEVVRCKDCKHWERICVDPVSVRDVGNCKCSQWENDYFWCQTHDNNYCFCGEKMDGAV